MSILGGLIGLSVGAAVGLANIIIMDDIYPPEWKKSYENNGAILFPICGYGLLSGTILGVIGGYVSKRKIHDYGLLGGTCGGVVGGLIGGTYGVYSNYQESI